MNDFRNIVNLLASNDPAAADAIDDLVARLQQIASRIRQQAKLKQGQPGTRDPGGMSDRVQMALIGPDGTIKRLIDTNLSNN